ncbi:MAG: haloperoxidase, partial [Algoriphagus sp.]
MSQRLNTVIASLVLIMVMIQSSFAKPKEINWPKLYAEELFHLTEVMVTDVASPPVAARIYAYSTLATYLVA